jgi:hypothetical protein
VLVVVALEEPVLLVSPVLVADVPVVSPAAALLVSPVPVVSPVLVAALELWSPALVSPDELVAALEEVSPPCADVSPVPCVWDACDVSPVVDAGSAHEKFGNMVVNVIVNTTMVDKNFVHPDVLCCVSL